jgi:hypothetical protein
MNHRQTDESHHHDQLIKDLEREHQVRANNEIREKKSAFFD